MRNKDTSRTPALDPPICRPKPPTRARGRCIRCPHPPRAPTCRRAQTPKTPDRTNFDSLGFDVSPSGGSPLFCFCFFNSLFFKTGV